MQPPGPDLVIACPKCSAPARLPAFRSGNTFGAELWTDGFMDAPMLSSNPIVTRCHACNGLFWLSDASRLGEMPEKTGGMDEAEEVDDAIAARWRSAPEVRSLTETEYYQALDEEPMSEDRERQLRTLAWHASNDAYRKKRSKKSAPQERERRNMERLLDLNRSVLFEGALLAAELARELGSWEEVPKYLDLPFPDEIADVGRRIANLAEARDARVARVR